MSTQAQLVTRVRQKVDEDTAAFWSDLTIQNAIQESYNYYWAFIIKLFEGYFAKTSNISFDGNTAGEYSLPADFFKAKLVSRIMVSQKVPLRYIERYDTTVATSIDFSTYNLPSYRFRGSKIIFEPAPSWVEANAIELEYIKQLSLLTSLVDVDTDFSSIPMAEDCVVIRAVCKCKGIEEMVAGGGADIDPFIKDLLTTEQMLKENVEQRTTARIVVEQFGEDDNESIVNWS